jgi:hypothetical protein
VIHRLIGLLIIALRLRITAYSTIKPLFESSSLQRTCTVSKLQSPTPREVIFGVFLAKHATSRLLFWSRARFYCISKRECFWHNKPLPVTLNRLESYVHMSLLHFLLYLDKIRTMLNILNISISIQIANGPILTLSNTGSSLVIPITLIIASNL